MPKQKTGSIKNYMTALTAIFLIVSVLTSVFFFRTIDNISIESDLYQNIKASNDLKADIFPPRLYIVESYLIVQQLVSEKDAQKTADLLQKMGETRQKYLNRYAYWMSNTHDQKIAGMIEESNTYVTAFYQLYDRQFLPALQKKDYPALGEIVNSQMKQLYEQHREIIDKMSNIIEASNADIENNAQIFADRSRLLLGTIYIILILIIVAISFIIFRKVRDIESNIVNSRHETEMANERLEAIVEGLKKFKHSYDNTLASIEGYVIQNDLQGLRAYLEEVVAEKNKHEIVNYFKIDFIKNPAVSGLIISKMIYAEKLGADFNLKVRSEVTDLPVKSSHLCEMLGILLDNAIEGAAESSDKKVNFKIYDLDDATVFEIGNSIDTMPDRVKMFEKGWTSKGENRGLGLWMVKDIIAGYENIILNTTVDKKYLEQELIIIKTLPDENETLFTDIL